MTTHENIPKELRLLPIWLVWKREEKEGRQTKVPYRADGGGRASSTDPTTWTYLPKAKATLDRDKYDGLGIGISDDLGAIDIDHCVTDGALSEMAADIVAMMDSYTEYSPSGQGIRILFKAKGFQYDKVRYYINNPNAKLEVYIAGCTNKYVTVTGSALFPGKSIAERSAQVTAVLEKYMLRPNSGNGGNSSNSGNSAIPAAPSIAEAELVAKIRASAQGADFERLWSGDTSAHNGDDSAADLALCNMLAFWTGKDATRMDELFRQSRLYRPKWDERHGARTYGEMTIDKAICDCREVYSASIGVQTAKPTSRAGDMSTQPTDAHALISLDQVNPQPPRYFWDPYVRLHNINIVRGDGGVGKTMFIMALAAAVTTGKQPEGMPGVLNSGQGAVSYYGTEDDPSEYANRALLCGCDRQYLHVVGEGSALPHLSQLDVLKTQIQQTGAKLIVFDPIQSFLGAGTDMNKANEVRPMLDGLRALCQEVGCTAIIIEHLNKATQQKAHYRGIGTVDIINACRSALMIGWHPEQKGLSVAVQIKANARYGQPVVFSINGEGKFTWHGVCDATEDEVANARRFKSSEAARDVVDPVLGLVLALMEKYPDGWTGTASQMLAEGSALVDCSLLTKPESIGRKLPGIHYELAKRGIVWNKKKATHSFSKRPQIALFKPAKEQVGQVRQDKQDIIASPTYPPTYPAG